MSANRISVVLSQTRSKNPAKRHLEEEIATALLLEPGTEFAVVPHIYDLYPGDTGLLYLNSLNGHVVVLSWLYPRGARWILDRNGVKGKEGVTLLKSLGEDEDDEDEPIEAVPEDGIGASDVPDRCVFFLDLRAYDDPKIYLDEIRRIAAEASVKLVPLGGLTRAETPKPQAAAPPDLMSWIQGSPKPEQLEQYLNAAPASAGATVLGESQKHRWYPVIDYARCTNCLECIDFCLFGVYGIDRKDTILVEHQDNCRQGCPACSRVCPQHAIIFPEHKTPAIAGAPGEGPGTMKIDLSRLFGAPNAIDVAARERDVELVRAGLDAVGLSVGIPKRQTGKPTHHKDDLDKLMDQLDDAGF